MQTIARCLMGVLAATAIVAAVSPSLPQGRTSSPTSESNMPSDIDPQSGFRLPLLKRDDLDEAGKQTYDRATTPGATIAGLQGPAGVQLYSPKTAVHHAAINRYLRFEAGLSPRVREIAILTTARELDSQFEWVAQSRKL